jgi:predicted nucleotidyltransferase
MTAKSIQHHAVLEALFTSQARIAVLKLLLMNANDRYYLREIESLTNLPVGSVQRELARLEKAALITSAPEGNRKYYQANREASVFPELHSLMIKTAGLGDLLRDQLLEQSELIELAFIFGSYAKRSEDAESDIDLFIIGDITGRRVSQILAPARDSLRREINTVIMNTQEAQGKYKDGNQFLASVIDEPKIFLIGEEDDLSSLLSRRTN